MRVPTDKELADRRENPDDSTTPPDTETIPVFIPASKRHHEARECSKRLAKYHDEFLKLAKEEGYQWNIPKYIESPVREEKFILAINIHQDPDILEHDLKAFCDHVREVASKARQGYKERQGALADRLLSNFVRNSKGKNPKPPDFELLENILTAYKLGLESKNNLSVAVDMKLVTDTKNRTACRSAERKIARWREKAQSLIKAAANGTFLEELNIPIPK